MNIGTLSIARDLRAAELPPEQAEAIAAAIGRAVSDSAVTKGDLDSARLALEQKTDQFRVALEQKISALDSKVDVKVELLRTEIERMRNQLMVSFIGTQVALAGIIFAVIKL